MDRTGAPWRDVPREFGPWQSVATRFHRWVESGEWNHVLAELQMQADAQGELDWTLHHVDGTSRRYGRNEAKLEAPRPRHRRGATVSPGLLGPSATLRR